MLKKLTYSGLILLLAVFISSAHVFAEVDKDLEKRADLAAKFIVSCRAIIAQQQNLFNNPDIGDKGFTGEIYATKVKDILRAQQVWMYLKKTLLPQTLRKRSWEFYLYPRKP